MTRVNSGQKTDREKSRNFILSEGKLTFKTRKSGKIDVITPLIEKAGRNISERSDLKDIFHNEVGKLLLSRYKGPGFKERSSVTTLL